VTVHLIHGFNVSDGGKNSVGKLRPYLLSRYQMHDYGWTGLIRLRITNAKATKNIGPLVEPGDVLVAHSNGAMICWSLVQEHSDKLAGIILINPALRRDTVWPDDLPVMCIYNSTDWVVGLGRMWSRLVSLGGLNFHGWGAAGRYGFTSEQPRVKNLDSAKGDVSAPSKGHSGLFKLPQVENWGKLIGKMAFAWEKAFMK